MNNQAQLMRFEEDVDAMALTFEKIGGIGLPELRLLLAQITRDAEDIGSLARKGNSLAEADPGVANTQRALYMEFCRKICKT